MKRGKTGLVSAEKTAGGKLSGEDIREHYADFLSVNVKLKDYQLKVHIINEDVTLVAQQVPRLPLVSEAKSIRTWMIF